MKHLSQPVRIAVLAVFGMVAAISLVTVSSATGNVSKGDLAGTWQITLGGVTGCGQATELANITLNSNGSGTGTLQTHGSCGDSSLTAQTFTISSLKNQRQRYGRPELRHRMRVGLHHPSVPRSLQLQPGRHHGSRQLPGGHSCASVVQSEAIPASRTSNGEPQGSPFPVDP